MQKRTVLMIMAVGGVVKGMVVMMVDIRMTGGRQTTTTSSS